MSFNWLWHLPLALASVTFLLPLAFMLATALAEPGEALRPARSVADVVVPQAWRWENFLEVRFPGCNGPAATGFSSPTLPP
jgi:ABC-type glycerol-3-phosphate transport system permease component